MWQLEKSGQMKPLLKIEGVKEPFNSARQELPKTWAQTGSVEVIKSQRFQKKIA